jgi:uncharacterized protein YcbK (DUF882 family)
VKLRYFKIEEFTCRCCGVADMNPVFLEWLDNLRHQAGFPLVIASGYRCPAHNQAVSSTGPDGPHTTGRAADVRVDRGRARRLMLLAERMDPPVQGLGINQKGSGRFLHLDLCDRPEPTVWTY